MCTSGEAQKRTHGAVFTTRQKHSFHCTSCLYFGSSIMIKASNLLCVLLSCISLSAVSSFAFGGAKSSGAADKAVEIFAEKFPFDRPPPPKTNNAGVPYADIDGTVIRKGMSGKRLTDLSEKEVRSNFKEMAKVYGEQEALDMVTIMPVALSFNAKNFAPSFKGYSAVFGEEDTKAMVGRNVSALEWFLVRLFLFPFPTDSYFLILTPVHLLFAIFW
jgi:hypothetical protein